MRRKGWLVTWIMPATLALVFGLLLTSANPVIEEALGQLNPLVLLDRIEPVRVVFWLFMAGCTWPLLAPRLRRRRERAARETDFLRPELSGLFGEASILRALIVFNAMFAVQTALDAVYLWGGATLPDGMSHADYAHRGAYPLIVTALLAALFVLVAMRPGGAAQDNRAIRWLVYAWIGQNIALVISSILRLDLYVEVYSLTELRLQAGLWMVLVAIGLALILVRIVLRRSNAWLVAANLVALAGMLWIYAVIDTPALIADFNVTHSLEVSGSGQPLDRAYLMGLGAGAVPALDRFIAATRDGEALEMRARMVADFRPPGPDWRSWTFRQSRLAAYLREHAIAPADRTDMN